MWDLRWMVKGFSLCALVSPVELASCYSLPPLMVLLEQASCYSLPPLMVLLELASCYSLPPLMVLIEQASCYSLFHSWFPGAGQLLLPVPFMVFLEQASCYSLFHSRCSWSRPAVIHCYTHGVPGSGQLPAVIHCSTHGFPVPLIVFLEQTSSYSLFHS